MPELVASANPMRYFLLHAGATSSMTSSHPRLRTPVVATPGVPLAIIVAVVVVAVALFAVGLSYYVLYRRTRS